MVVIGGYVDRYPLSEPLAGKQLVDIGGAAPAAAKDNKPALRGLGQRNGVLEIVGGPRGRHDDGIEVRATDAPVARASAPGELTMSLVLPYVRQNATDHAFPPAKMTDQLGVMYRCLRATDTARNQ